MDVNTGADGTKTSINLGNPKGRALLERAQQIRFSLSTVANRAGVNKHTVYRVSEHDILQSNFDAIERVIVAEELALRDYLNRLHPTPEDTGPFEPEALAEEASAGGAA